MNVNTRSLARFSERKRERYTAREDIPENRLYIECGVEKKEGGRRRGAAAAARIDRSNVCMQCAVRRFSKIARSVLRESKRTVPRVHIIRIHANTR